MITSARSRHHAVSRARLRVGGYSGKYGLMASDDVLEQVRALRGQGYSPQQIARALVLPPATVAPLVRAIAVRSAGIQPGPGVRLSRSRRSLACARSGASPRCRIELRERRDSADNVVMPDLDPAPVLDAVARDPRLRVFLGQGKIETMPARQSRRRLLLDVIAQAFEPGVRYSERRVSLFLAGVHDDYAALRRYLVDEDFLSRADGQYWRSGGTVLPSPASEVGQEINDHS
jgi:hypothetical protein